MTLAYLLPFDYFPYTWVIKKIKLEKRLTPEDQQQQQKLLQDILEVGLRR